MNMSGVQRRKSNPVFGEDESAEISSRGRLFVFSKMKIACSHYSHLRFVFGFLELVALRFVSDRLDLQTSLVDCEQSEQCGQESAGVQTRVRAAGSESERECGEEVGERRAER